MQITISDTAKKLLQDVVDTDSTNHKLLNDTLVSILMDHLTPEQRTTFYELSVKDNPEAALDYLVSVVPDFYSIITSALMDAFTVR